MAGGRFGNGPLDDDQPIGFWMDDQNDQIAQRDALAAAGSERWAGSTSTGENLDASRPTDVVALGGPTSPPGDDTASQSASADEPDSSEISSEPRVAPSGAADVPRYVKAQPGDNITRLVGGSDPGALGAFARLNGMDRRASTIYAGRAYRIPTAADVSEGDAALGEQLLRHDNTELAARRRGQAANDLFLARFNAGQNVWTGAPTAAGPPSSGRFTPSALPPNPKPAWYDNALLKVPAGAASFGGGLLFGSLVRGPIRTGQFIGDTLDFGRRLLDPKDAEYHPLNSAQDEVSDFKRGVVDLARWAANDPEGTVRHIFHEARSAHDPTSIPIARTLVDEAHNQFEIGANDGEFLTPLQVIQRAKGAVELIQGGEDVARAARYARNVKPGEYKRLIARGDPHELADYLSDPYSDDAMGSHLIARKEKFPDTVLGIPLPEKLAGQPLPRSYIDSSWNVNKFKGLSRDQAYTEHYGYGAGFYGARLPADVNGGKGWSGRRLGLRRYGPVERIVRGAPPTLKKAVAGGAAVGGLTAYNVFGGDRPE